MMVEFQIPSEADDLLATDASTFSVASFTNDGTEIISNSVFDVFFSLCRCFGDLTPTIRKGTCSALCAGLQWLERTLKSRLDDISSNSTNAQMFRNAIKMYMYLFSVISAHEESEAAKATQHLRDGQSQGK
eukprot:gene10629-2746_t